MCGVCIGSMITVCASLLVPLLLVLCQRGGKNYLPPLSWEIDQSALLHSLFPSINGFPQFCPFSPQCLPTHTHKHITMGMKNGSRGCSGL